jgi:hypothetical protein
VSSLGVYSNSLTLTNSVQRQGGPTSTSFHYSSIFVGNGTYSGTLIVGGDTAKSTSIVLTPPTGRAGLLTIGDSGTGSVIVKDTASIKATTTSVGASTAAPGDGTLAVSGDGTSFQTNTLAVGDASGSFGYFNVSDSANVETGTTSVYGVVTDSNGDPTSMPQRIWNTTSFTVFSGGYVDVSGGK